MRYLRFPLLVVASLFALLQIALAGIDLCPNCNVTKYIQGCWYCNKNGSDPGVCTCTLLYPMGSQCANGTLTCGNCSGEAQCGMVHCDQACFGCCTDLGGNNCCPGPEAAKPEVKPLIGNWVKNTQIGVAVRVHSPLIADILEELTTVEPARLACPNLNGKIVDRTTNEISKYTINTNPEGSVTVITLYTRSTDQEEILSVHAGKGMWLLYREARVTGQEEHSGERTLVAKGQFGSTEPGPGPVDQLKDLMKDRLDLGSGAVKGGTRLT